MLPLVAAALLLDVCDPRRSSEAASILQEDVQLLWMLEAATDVLHSILWHLSESGLPDFKNTLLFESLCSMYAALPSLPSAAATLIGAVASSAQDMVALAQHSDDRTAATLSLNAALLRTMALFLESKWTSRLQPLLERAPDGRRRRQRSLR